MKLYALKMNKRILYTHSDKSENLNLLFFNNFMLNIYASGGRMSEDEKDVFLFQVRKLKL